MKNTLANAMFSTPRTDEQTGAVTGFSNLNYYFEVDDIDCKNMTKDDFPEYLKSTFNESTEIRCIED